MDDKKQTTNIEDNAAKASNEAAPVSRSRRAALVKLGLAAGVAYAAPTILRIDRSARAQAPSQPGNGGGNGGGGGNSGCTPGQQKKGLC